MKESMSFMHGSETKLQLKLYASHHLSKFYILQAKCSVRLKSQGLERERHKHIHQKVAALEENSDLLLQSFVLQQLPCPFPNTACSADFWRA